MKMNTFNTVFVGKLISFVPKNRYIVLVLEETKDSFY